MTTMTQSLPDTKSATLTIVFAAFIGLGIVAFTGHVQASTALHDAAHDLRHAAGFPCH